MKRKRIENGRAPGRPRSEAAHAAILSAAVALVRERGYDALALDAVAARAGVGKATLYRRWKSKETLMAEAVLRIVRDFPLPDTGSARGDLRAVMRSELALYQDPATPGLLAGLVSAMARSERIAGAVRGGFVAARRAAVRGVLERAVRRGELRRGLDPELATDVLAGPLFLRQLFTGGRIDQRLARDLVDVVLTAFAPRVKR